MKKFILSNLHIHTEQEILKNASIVLQDHLIHQIGSDQQDHDAEVIKFPDGYQLVPGFIDLHTHGIAGCDVMDASIDALATMASHLAQEGTTGFLATTMTADVKQLEQVLRVISDYMDQQASMPGAKILGVHLEGPFLSAKKVGAQSAHSILSPDIELIAAWQKLTQNKIKLVTLAPELPNSLECIRYLRQQGIIASIGHTDATFAESLAAIDAGCIHATHLFNAMRGMHQREPGAVTAALLSDQVLVELIVDQVHLHPAIVQLALKLKGSEKIALVTDAMRAKCLADGQYDLGGQSVFVKNNVASLADGTLAGSVLKMNSAIQNILNFTGCSLSDAVKMAAANPAKALGIFSYQGSIAVGKQANLVVLDQKLNVVLTLCGGDIIYQSMT